MTSTFSGPSFRYISPTELGELMKSEKKPMKDYAVVDVRDDDFLGGNIVGCVRAPSSNYLTTVDDLISKTKDVPQMVFHCALSQQRGPKAARVYAETRNNRLNPGETSAQEIYVLRGGFTEFQRLFKDDPVLVEKWRKEVWQGY
ncbi:Dual specificity phosphatase ibp1 OS=Schizosaccharomyces pombe (strain 972 / ATCC 24843) GN=ibp1 PE=1 SV=1 [Rhizoctonia solani AG-1 IB]|uniref:Dual specificity phosphatase ibp1 n=1 Tax=Thanatephorus cucumeris (strain AG1-IB / isolate 7/3/14) TaxID=1108050 RepID=A0A0B7FXU0_THACB|nr:Dual specificity phosphatase ibp1 OS=Schizosaccharomyces pombe (strain 972 / ATCC 24843) GN=ibp1 PE=1 SV=1 [Rhizoctonia solani AG-1 IB]